MGPLYNFVANHWAIYIVPPAHLDYDADCMQEHNISWGRELLATLVMAPDCHKH